MQTIQGLKDYKITELQNIFSSHLDYLRESFHFEDLDFTIQNITPFGSRILGIAKNNSDLDVKIKYIGSAREDDLLNALNNRQARLKIENIKVDFYPEKIQEQDFPRRGNWATHKSDWRGNWSPEVARNLILRYSKEKDHLLDCMIGGGTTAIEAKILNRHITCIDVNEEALERTKKSLEF